MATKKNETETALTTTETESLAHVLSGQGWEVVDTAGKSQWAVIVDDPEPFKPVDLRDSRKGLENVVEGYLLGKDYLPDSDGTGERGYYKIQLLRPCLVAAEDGSDWASEGTIVNLGERARLSSLDDLINVPDAVVHVLIHAAQKIPGRAGKTLWTFNILKRVVRKAPEGNA